MASRHSGNFESSFGVGVLDIDQHLVEEIEIMHRGESFAFAFGGQMRFGMRSRDDGEGAAEGGFHMLVEMIATRRQNVRKCVCVGLLGDLGRALHYKNGIVRRLSKGNARKEIRRECEDVAQRTRDSGTRGPSRC